MTLTEIPDHIAVYFELGGCIQKCKNCHSPYHQEAGNLVSIDFLHDYARGQKEIGANAIVLMGGTTSRFLSKQDVAKIINRLSRVLPIGLYSGTEVDDFFMSNEKLRWYKAGAYIDTLGGLTSVKTNQRFYHRTESGEWELRNDLFQTSNKQ